MRISVHVKPNSKKGPLVEKIGENDFVIFLRERPVDGAANAALIKLLADYFGVAKSQITIKSGASSKHKIIEIS